MSQKSVQVSSQARLIVSGVALLLTLGMGIRQSFGLFLTPVSRDLALTAADFTLTLAIQNIVWGLSQAFVGATADRYGLRITMMVGAAIYILGLALGSKAAQKLVETRSNVTTADRSPTQAGDQFGDYVPTSAINANGSMVAAGGPPPNGVASASGTSTITE